VQTPLTSLISIGEKRIRSPRDLAGARVGTAGIPYQSAYLRTILARAGVPAGSVKETSIGFNFVPAMLSKRVDATLGGFSNYEAIDLARRRRNPSVLRVDRLGVPTYPELVFTADSDRLDEQGASRVRRFLQATARGYRRARDDTPAAVDALLDANRDLDRGLQEAGVKATLPSFFPADRDRPFGAQVPDQWQAYGEWMLANKLVKRQPNAATALTNEFLPGEGLKPTE